MSAPTFGRSVRLSTRCCDRTKSVQRRKPGEPHCGDHGARAASCFRASVAVSHRPGPDRDPMSRQQSLRHERPPAVLSPDLCPLATEDRETLHKDGGPGSSFLCQSRLLDIRRQPRFPRESECVPRTRGRTVLGQPLAGSGGNRFSGEAVGGEPLDGKTLRQISFVGRVRRRKLHAECIDRGPRARRCVFQTGRPLRRREARRLHVRKLRRCRPKCARSQWRDCQKTRHQQHRGHEWSA